MRTIALICCSALLVLPSRAADTRGAAQTNRNDETKRYVVMLKRTVDQDGCVNELAVNRQRILRHAINGFVTELNLAAADRLRNDERVLSIVESRQTSRSLGQIIPTGLRRMSVPQFPAVKVDGTDRRVDVDVAVLDGGIQVNHPDLNIVNAVDVTWRQWGPISTVNDHATAIAGIIGALDNDFGVVGIAPGARIWSVRNTDDNGRLWHEDIMAAFDYVAQHAQEIEIVNCSFGTDYGFVSQGRAQYQAAISALVNQGVVVVAGVGNDATDIAGPDGVLGSVWDDDRLPAALPEVMAVSAIDPVTDQMAVFSSYSASSHSPRYVYSPGAAIDVAAPGLGLTTTTLNSGYGHNYAGTSFACPHAVGIVALYIATHGRPTNAAGVYAVRQDVVDASIPRSQWHSANPGDRDTNHEGLASASLAWVTNRPELLNIVKAATGVDITLRSMTGYVHTLQFTPVLGSSNQWTDLTSTNGKDSTITLTDSAEANSRFYRLATQPETWPPIDLLAATNSGSVGTLGDGTYVLVQHGKTGAIASEPTELAAHFPLDKQGSYVRVPFLPQFNQAAAFSFEVWVKPAAQDIQTLGSSLNFDELSRGVYRRNGWLLYQSGSSLTSGNGFYFRCHNTSGDNAYVAATVDLPVDTNRWYFVCGTYDGSSVSLFVDGSLVASNPMTSFRPNVIDPLTIGTRTDHVYYFSGTLDEAAFYTNALSAAQVLTHYQAGTNAAPPIPYQQIILNDNPAGYWRFEEH